MVYRHRLPSSQPGLRKCLGPNVSASAACCPSTNLSKGGLQVTLCEKFRRQGGKVFFTYQSWEISFLHKTGHFGVVLSSIHFTVILAGLKLKYCSLYQGLRYIKAL